MASARKRTVLRDAVKRSELGRCMYDAVLWISRKMRTDRGVNFALLNKVRATRVARLTHRCHC
eukprot:8135188-Karenia_brevis.AAC.1